jgi:hypothetical protein
MSYQQNRVDADVSISVDTPKHGRFRVLLDFKTINGRFEVGAIQIEATEPDTPVTAVAIRSIGLAELIRDARAGYTALHRSATTRKSTLPPIENPDPTALAQAGPDSTRDLTAEDLLLVASLYNDAYQRGQPVQRYVAETLGIAISTAARRISLARNAGYINPEINKRRRKNN